MRSARRAARGPRRRRAASAGRASARASQTARSARGARAKPRGSARRGRRRPSRARRATRRSRSVRVRVPPRAAGAPRCARCRRGGRRWPTLPPGSRGRWRAAQTWTDTEYFVWGGSNGGGDAYYADGARWNLKTNTWKPIAKAPTELAGRVGASAVATGVDVIVWGGQTISGSPATRNTGARYVAVRDEWVSMAVSPLKPRHSHAAAWTGSKMIVWGGHSGVASDMLADGAIYDPGTDAWSTLPAAPIDGRSAPAATWTGEEFIVFGGTIGEITGARDGAAFNPTTGLWRKIEPYSGPIRDLPGVTVGPKSVFVFGGFTLSGSLELQNDGAW
ncbi:MAG: hypothetical protein IPJ34_09445 [Myxococcales bacterium]|nr:hypothetical protein [Myxococcales bacterium]